MKKVAFPILVAVTGSLVAGPATWAMQHTQAPPERPPQTEQAPVPSQTPPERFQDRSMISDGRIEASDVLGLTVKDSAGEEVGTLRDVLLDREAGRITHGIVGIGGLLGFAEKHVAVAWNELMLNPDVTEFTMQQRKEELEQAPAYEKVEKPTQRQRRPQAAPGGQTMQ